MGFFHEYPYTDAHELNLDWIIEQITQLDLDIKGIEDRATAKAIAESKIYIDEEIADLELRFNALSSEVSQLSTHFDSTVGTLQSQYNNFVGQVNAQLTLMNDRIQDLKDTIDADIVGVNARTDLAIQQNNEYIFDVIERGLTTELRVVNYFTGESVSIQDMFNYLANFHTENGATITEIVNAQKTINQIININASCSEWVINGRILIA